MKHFFIYTLSVFMISLFIDLGAEKNRTDYRMEKGLIIKGGGKKTSCGFYNTR
jgi:hypothetical protein